MPEEPEVDTDKLHEAIHEEMEKEGGRLLRGIALTTALLAGLAALASLQAGHTVNEALVLKTESARLETVAADQWAYYQAKGVKAAVTEGSAAAWAALGKAPPPGLAAKLARYNAEQDSVRRLALESGKERDARSREADRLLERHRSFAGAVALFQVAIALGAVAALTRLRLVWLGSIALGVAGLVMFVLPLVR